MPAQPLSPEQKADAARLAALFKKWQARRRAEGLPSSQEAAADLIELGESGQSTMSQYIRGKIPLNVKMVAKCATLFGCLPEEISPLIAAQIQSLSLAVTDGAANHMNRESDAPFNAQNSGVIVKSAPHDGHTMGVSHAEPGLTFKGEVPLISWDLARTWDSTMASIRDDETIYRLQCPAPHSASTFCIENTTDAMDDGSPGAYPQGDILYVDPESPVPPDKDAIFILPGGKMLFRRYKEDSEGPYLLALNGKRIDRWEDGTIIRGRVIFSGKFR